MPLDAARRGAGRRQAAEKISEKNKNGACVYGKPCYIFVVCSARQTGLLSHAGLPNPQKPGKPGASQREFFCFGV
jgi:hypothetical protein